MLLPSHNHNNTHDDDHHNNPCLLRCMSLVPSTPLLFPNTKACHPANTTPMIQKVTRLSDVHCISAQPIQSSNGQAVDILLCCSTSSNKNQQKDNHHNNSNDTRLELYRANKRICKCALPQFQPTTADPAEIRITSKANHKKQQQQSSRKNPSSRVLPGSTIHTLPLVDFLSKQQTANVIHLSNPISNRIDCTVTRPNKPHHSSSSYIPEEDEIVIVRASLSLVAFDSPLTEAALCAIEHSSSFSLRENNEDAPTNRNPNFELAYEIRANVMKMIQIIPIYLEDAQLERVSDPIWSSFSFLMKYLLDRSLSTATTTRTNVYTQDDMEDLSREDDDDDELKEEDKYKMGGIPPGTSFDSSEDGSGGGDSWSQLLNSEFHKMYSRENPDLFAFESHCQEMHPKSSKRGKSQRSTNKKEVPEEVNGNTETWIPYWTKWEQDLLHNLNRDEGEDGLLSNFCRNDGTFVTKESVRDYFDALHLLYEDAKLCIGSRGDGWLYPLGTLLMQLAHRAGNDEKEENENVMNDFIEFYGRDLKHIPPLTLSSSGAAVATTTTGRSNTVLPRRITSYDKPPCLFSWIHDMFQSDTVDPFPTKSQCNESTQMICRFFSILFDPTNTDPGLSLCITQDPANGVRIQSPSDAMDTNIDPTSQQQSRDRRLVLSMVSHNLQSPSDILLLYPPSITLPLMEALSRCRADPPPPTSAIFSPLAFILIGREDLASMEQINRGLQRNPKPRSPMARYLGSTGGGNGVPSSSSSSSHPNPNEEEDKDGLSSMELFSSMLFPNDTRIHEAGRLLRSSRPLFLRVARAVEISDHDYERVKQARLLLLCRRAVSLPLGRGMLTFGSIKPMVADPLPIPDLCLAGRVPPNDATLQLDTSSCPDDMTVWPEFHNGVASGLRVGFTHRDQRGGGSSGGNGSGITRTWIVYNKPSSNNNQSQQQPPQNRNNNNANNPNNNAANNPNNTPPINHSHGGLLMALGLTGHLSVLAMTDIYEYLTQGTVTTTIGVLLGMAANKRSTCDPSVSKMLCLHIPSLLPPSFAAMEVAAPARAAAVAGIGLLYMGSSHRLMTEFLLNEMGMRPSTDNFGTHDRESYTLSCGLALGMVNLGRGEKQHHFNHHQSDNDNKEEEDTNKGGGSAGLADLKIEERLHRYIVGGRDDVESRSRREAAERATNAGGNAGEPERCSRIYEGDSINTDVTAPGATLALGLMFLRSGNRSVASRLELPDTHFLLDYVRPDLLLLRVVSRALILWDDVQPTSEWIDDQIPTVVNNSYHNLKICVQRSMSGGAGAGGGGAALAGILLGDDDEEDEDGENMIEVKGIDAQPHGNKHNNNTQQDMDQSPDQEEDSNIDRQAIRQAHAHIVAGACFGLGLRYAGTGNVHAASAISERVRDFRKLRDENNDPVCIAQRPETPILEMCLGCAAISLAMVMAGTGDLDTMRLLRELRWRCDEDVRYGNHMAYGAAIGLIFLGGGACTLGREPEDIAALVMAFFPRFPAITSDNQYHLQALRHFYALAVRHRELEAIDVETQEPVFVPIEVDFNDDKKATMKLTAPCLLPNQGSISQLRVASERYYPVTLDIGPSTTKTNNTTTSADSHISLYVKKKSGHLSYVQDPHALRSLMVQTGGGGNDGSSALDLIRSFTEDPKLLVFAEFLCDGGNSKGGQKSKKQHPQEHGGKGMIGTTLETFCTEILYECLTQEKPEAVPLYLALRSYVTSFERNGAANVRDIWDIRLVKSYYDCLEQRQDLLSSSQRTKGEVVPRRRMLSQDFVALLSEHVDRFFRKKGFTGNNIRSYFDGGEDCDASFLVWNDVPSPYSRSGVRIKVPEGVWKG